jgi:hypothetical protein
LAINKGHPGYEKKLARQREWNARNRERVREYNRQWRRRNPEAERATQRKHLYGVTPDQYEQMVLRQAGVCAVCLEPETRRLKGGGISPLSVDHCHETKRVRGLLCHTCYLALGYAKDSPERLRRLAEYLG